MGEVRGAALRLQADLLERRARRVGRAVRSTRRHDAPDFPKVVEAADLRDGRVAHLVRERLQRRVPRIRGRLGEARLGREDGRVELGLAVAPRSARARAGLQQFEARALLERGLDLLLAPRQSGIPVSCLDRVEGVGRRFLHRRIGERPPQQREQPRELGRALQHRGVVVA